MKKATLSTFAVLFAFILIFSNMKAALADQDEPNEVGLCENISLITLPACKFQYTITTMRRLGKDTRDGKAALIETAALMEWLGYFHDLIWNAVLVDLHKKNKLNEAQIQGMTTDKTILEILLGYTGNESLLYGVRIPDWESLAPLGNDSEKNILEKSRTGEWIIINTISFDAASEEFSAMNVAYDLAVLVENGVLPRKDAVAFGIPAMNHKDYKKAKELFGL